VLDIRSAVRDVESRKDPKLQKCANEAKVDLDNMENTRQIFRRGGSELDRSQQEGWKSRERSHGTRINQLDNAEFIEFADRDYESLFRQPPSRGCAVWGSAPEVEAIRSVAQAGVPTAGTPAGDLRHTFPRPQTAVGCRNSLRRKAVTQCDAIPPGILRRNSLRRKVVTQCDALLGVFPPGKDGGPHRRGRGRRGRSGWPRRVGSGRGRSRFRLVGATTRRP
jgi:hypothetical protein